MKFTALTLALLAASGAQADFTNPPSPEKLNKRAQGFGGISGVVKRAAGYTFDMFQGTNLQQSLVTKPASELGYTGENGRPIHSPVEWQRAGKDGPLLLQDSHMIDTLARFVRERIPERVVHARGYGAHGRFTVTTNFAEQYSMAEAFKQGTDLPMSMRFSTVGGRSGSCDVARDPRGFSIKIRTKQGNLDWVGNNTPVFFIRDPTKFPMFIHTQKTNPQTNARDKNMVFDYLWQNPEASLQFFRLFSDLGTPISARFMSGWTSHTFRLVKEDGSWVYVRTLFETDQGVRNFTDADATTMCGKNQEYATTDLFNAIEQGEYPSWTVKFAVMTPEEGAKYRYNVNDLTKDWISTPDFNVTYHEVGKLTLTQNPLNYHDEIEQAHYSPSNVVPGWAPSEDPVLQSRLFSYNDAARHRLGANYMQIPVNCPFAPVANYDRDGGITTNGNFGKQQSYADSSGTYKPADRVGLVQNALASNASVEYYTWPTTDLDYEQPRLWYQSLAPQDQANLASNFGGALAQVTQAGVVDNVLKLFTTIDGNLANAVRQQIDAAKAKGN